MLLENYIPGRTIHGLDEGEWGHILVKVAFRKS